MDFYEVEPFYVGWPKKKRVVRWAMLCSTVGIQLGVARLRPKVTFLHT